jgi:hypothetical protein
MYKTALLIARNQVAGNTKQGLNAPSLVCPHVSKMMLSVLPCEIIQEAMQNSAGRIMV